MLFTKLMNFIRENEHSKYGYEEITEAMSEMSSLRERFKDVWQIYSHRGVKSPLDLTLSLLKKDAEDDTKFSAAELVAINDYVESILELDDSIQLSVASSIAASLSVSIES